ncbi:glutaredoxin family protein [Pontibacterium sp.]|uniref:glutaredoxin family protein n=1 Tax=Pontibacterium sp. TaxID=2036026 RepID=UPI0035176057
MAFVRWFLGRIILLLNFIFSPRSVKRPADAQAKIDQRTQNMSLYQFEACPFCVKVRRAMKRNALNIELRDVKNDNTHRTTLQNEGGRVKVPCLRIEKEDGSVQWMYESKEIIAYLENEVVAA